MGSTSLYRLIKCDGWSCSELKDNRSKILRQGNEWTRARTLSNDVAGLERHRIADSRQKEAIHGNARLNDAECAYPDRKQYHQEEVDERGTTSGL